MSELTQAANHFLAAARPFKAAIELAEAIEKAGRIDNAVGDAQARLNAVTKQIADAKAARDAALAEVLKAQEDVASWKKAEEESSDRAAQRVNIILAEAHDKAEEIVRAAHAKKRELEALNQKGLAALAEVGAANESARAELKAVQDKIAVVKAQAAAMAR
jgi:hypothetical protein